MKRYKVRFMPEAEDDLMRLYAASDAVTQLGTCSRRRLTPIRLVAPPQVGPLLLGSRRSLLERDVTAAERALDAIKAAVELLQFSPFSCRKVTRGKPFLRELVIPFGAGGYVALFEIDSRDTVSILAVRHQREEDYQ